MFNTPCRISTQAGENHQNHIHIQPNSTMNMIQFQIVLSYLVLKMVFTKFAVTLTLPAGMVKVVVALFAFARLTPVAVQFLNFWFLGAAFAVMVTVAPAAAVVTLAVPPLTVTV